MARISRKVNFLDHIRCKCPGRYADIESCDYIDCTTPIELTCAVHGVSFKMAPQAVQRSNSTRTPGCPECRREAKVINGRKSRGPAAARRQQQMQEHEMEVSAEQKVLETGRGLRYMKEPPARYHPYDAKTGTIYSAIDGRVLYRLNKFAVNEPQT